MAEQPELLGTAGCHLCEQAEVLVSMVLGKRSVAWRYTDVAMDATLLEGYGDRIPVFRYGGRALYWPFGLLDVRRLVEEKDR